MSAQFCSKCGGQNPSGAAFCQYCGSPMQGAPAAPPLASTPSAVTAAPASIWPPPPPGGYASAPPPPPRRSRRLVLVVIVVVILIIVAVVGVLAYEASQTVSVNSIYFVSPDNTCGLNDTVYPQGFNVSLGQTVPVGLQMYGNGTFGNSSACTVHSVTSESSGFTITTQNTPLVAPANTETTVLWLNITVPSSSFSGSITLSAT